VPVAGGEALVVDAGRGVRALLGHLAPGAERALRARPTRISTRITSRVDPRWRGRLARDAAQPPNFETIGEVNRRGHTDEHPAELEFGPNRCAVTAML